MVIQVSQYPKNADSTPMDLLVGVLTDETGNSGSRLANVPVGPDKAPIDAVGLVLIDKDGNPKPFPDRIVTPEQFGAVGDDTHDDGPAFAAAIAWLRANSDGAESTYYKGSARLKVGAKAYFLNGTTLDINHTIIIEGEGTGLDGGIPTQLRWAAGATGIRVQRYNTTGASGSDAGSQKAGDGSIIRGLLLKGGYTTTEGEFHGIQLRARAVIEDCYIWNFQGDGVCINATAGGGTEGNANCWQLNRVTCSGNRSGFYADGADTNAGVAVGCNAQANRRWGAWESAFLGNTWVGLHLADNGLVQGSIPTVVSYSGNRYTVKAGQSAGAATNAPSGTTADNTWWIYLSAGGPSVSNNIPTWANPTTVREGGAYYADNANQTYAVFLNAYSEGGQGKPQTHESTALVLGGAEPTGNRIGVESGYIKVGPLRTNYLENSGPSFLSDKLTIENASAALAQMRIKWGNSLGTLYHNGSGFNIEAYDLGGSYLPAIVAGTNLLFWHNGVTQIVDIDSTGIKLSAGKVLKVGGVQVVGMQGAAVTDGVNAAAAPTQAEFNALVTQFNALLGRVRAHGLIA